jgi:hypothetical protein
VKLGSAIKRFANWHSVGRELLWAIATGLVSLFVSCAVLGINFLTISMRWQTNEADDHTQHYMIAKTITDSPFLGPNSRMGFPTTENLFFAPNWDPASAIVLRFEALFTSNGILILNIYNVIGFFSIGFAAYFFFRALRVRRWIAIVFALVLSFAPYEYQRISFGHAFVANYWAVPLLGILILSVAGPRTDPFERWINASATVRMRRTRRLLPLVFLTLMVSLSLSYYFVFAVIILVGILAARLIGAMIERLRPRLLLWPIVTVGMLILFIAIQLGTLSLNFNDRYAKYFGQRSPIESEVQAGKITTLLLPWTGSGFHFLANLTKKYIDTSPVSIYAEPPGTPIVAAIAMVLTVVFILVRLLRTGNSTEPLTALGRFMRDPRATVLSFAFLWGLLFFTVSGLGVIFALVVSPEIRSWARMSIVLITVSLGFLAILVDTAFPRLRAALPVVGVIAIIAIVDQLAGVPTAVSIQATTDSSLRHFVATAENKLADNCGVVQLPLKGFPATGPIGAMSDYNQALPYILSTKDTLRWSYGAVLGTKDALFWSGITSKTQFAAAVRKSGACAIEVDKFGYDTKQAAAQWKSWVDSVANSKHPLIVSSDSDHRYLLFKVAP